jgi:enoyl-CoA hydratase/carnithine racemase
VALGVLPGTGGTQRLSRLVGKARAMDLLVSGRLMGMDEALGLGLVTEVWDAAKLSGRTFQEAVVEYAATFAPPHKASRAVGRIKRAVQSGPEAGFSEGLAIERELQQLLFQSDDAREGIAANLEKRPPKFSGT